jgi:hypothetical protein
VIIKVDRYSILRFNGTQEIEMRDFCVRAKLCNNSEIKFRLYDWDKEEYFTEEMTAEDLKSYMVEQVNAVISQASVSGTAYFFEEQDGAPGENGNTLDDPWE